MSPVAAGGHHGHVPTRAAARAAKSALVEALGADPGVVGIGLARREDGYVLKVNLADPAPPRGCPATSTASGWSPR